MVELAFNFIKILVKYSCVTKLVVLEKTPSINIVLKIGGYLTMRTLEEIALERLKRRKEYGKRNGKGTFVRSNIAHV